MHSDSPPIQARRPCPHPPLRSWRADGLGPASAARAAKTFLAAGAILPDAERLARDLRAERRRMGAVGYDLDRHAALARACRRPGSWGPERRSEPHGAPPPAETALPSAAPRSR